MLRYKRNLILDVYDYSGNKQCTLYDSTSDLSGQATDVVVTIERNGWKELSFTIPTTCESENGGQEENFRLKYLIADYRIRLKDDDGIDWFLISEPKITHNVYSKDVSVSAGHISQLLKTKNLGLEFSDQEGNNVGTAEDLLTKILDGTGWSVGSVADFKEKRSGATKIRSMKASAKTGAFKLISNMCDLFEAKPVYHGDQKTVDIIPMNPFSEPEDGSLPDVATGECIELHYGKNVKNVTRTLNTENLVTKLYVYGAYGDAVNGYCGIDEWHHKEYVLTPPGAIPAGTQCTFSVTDDVAGITYTRYFVAKNAISASARLIWQMLDPASMSYVWDEENNAAYSVSDKADTNYNLIINTANPSTTAAKRPRLIHQSSNTGFRTGSTAATAEHGMRVTLNSSINWQYIYFGPSGNGSGTMHGLEPGQTYTMSFDATWKLESGLATPATDNFVVFINVDRGTNKYSTLAKKTIKTFTTGEETQERCESFTFTIPDDCVRCYIGIRANSSTAANYAKGDFIEIRNVKLEAGSVATPWCPSESEQTLTVTETNVVDNKVSYLMDFDYYRSVGLLTDEMLDEVGAFQREIPTLLDTAQTNAAAYASTINDLSDTIGTPDFCKLSAQYDTSGEYLGLNLNTGTGGYPKGVIYRTDYALKESKQFQWRTTSNIYPNGDPYENYAAVVYIVHTHTDPCTYDIGYLRAVNDHLEPTEDDQKAPTKLSLWLKSANFDDSHSNTDHIYLFRQNSIIGDLGAMMLQDEDVEDALKESVRSLNKGDRPVYYTDQAITTANPGFDFVGYAWAWRYYKDNSHPSEMYFCNLDAGDVSWHRTFVTKDPPANTLGSDQDYAYCWKEGSLYRKNSNAWEKQTNKSTADDKFGRMVSSFGTVYNSCVDRDMIRNGHYEYYAVDAQENLPVGNYAIEDPFGVYHTFTTKAQTDQGKRISYDWANGWVAIFNSGTDPQSVDITTVIDDALTSSQYRYDSVFDSGEDVLSNAIWESGSITVGSDPKAGSPYIIMGGGEVVDASQQRTGFRGIYPKIIYRLTRPGNLECVVHFYTAEHGYLGCRTLSAGSSSDSTVTEITAPAYARFARIVTSSEASTESFSMQSKYADQSFVVQEEEYRNLGIGTGYGKLKGIIPMIKKFQELSDLAYLVQLDAVKTAQAAVKEAENHLIDVLGDIYREGYWQKADYVDGDEEKLYDDGMENLKKIAKPDTTYNVQYLDLYGANTAEHEYAENGIVAKTYWPDLSSNYAVHLVDPDIGISQWAFIDKIQKCYDMPWKTTISINTNLTTIQQHTFTDVMTHIADVASQVKGKMELYDRAKAFDEDGKMSTSTLQGVIDANTLLITGGASTWYTDDKGNMVFVSADEKSAMTLTGNGFAIANQKDEWGEWIWRTFGTGSGFTADLITAGTLQADRIRAGSITPAKASPDFGTYIDLSENGTIIANANAAKSYTDGKTQDTMQEIKNVTQELNAVDGKFANYVEQTVYNGDKTEIVNMVTAVEQTSNGVKTKVDDYINEMGTCVEITTNGLELRQRQDSEYYAMLTANSIDFKNRSNDESVASFGAGGAYIDKVRSRKVLSVGTEENGWYDMTALPGGVADKWRDGTASVLKPIIIKQPEDYYADFQAGSHPLTNATEWPESFTFTVEAENVASYQWQCKSVFATNWTDSDASGNQTKTITSRYDRTRLSFAYRCRITGNDGTVLYTNEVQPRMSDAPVVLAQPKVYQEAAVDDVVTAKFYVTNASSYQWQYRNGNKYNGAWKNIGSANNPQAPTRASTSSVARRAYYRCVLTGTNGAISVTDEYSIEWK